MVPIRKFILLMLVFALSLTVFAGCAAEEPAPVGPVQRLLITSGAVGEDYWPIIYPAEMDGNYNGIVITSKVIGNLMITLDGKEYPLADALRDQHITAEEICAYARIDARNGFCEEIAISEKGVSRFIYRYPDYEMSVMHDVFETPDGQQHIMNEINFMPLFGIYNLRFDFDAREKTYSMYLPLDREDWGIDFQVTSASSSGITLKATQSGGQQIGQLQLDSYYINILQEVYHPDDPSYPTVEIPAIDLVMGGSTEITIDWSENYSDVPPGNYYIVFWINDIFRPEDVHPLMMDYHTTQVYFAEFTISEE